MSMKTGKLKANCLQGLLIAVSLLILLSMASLIFFGNGEVLAKLLADDCSSECRDHCGEESRDDCGSSCDCVKCPPTLLSVDIAYWKHSTLPTQTQLKPDEGGSSSLFKIKGSRPERSPLLMNDANSLACFPG